MAAGTGTPAVAAAGGSQEGSGGRADSLVPSAAGGVMVTLITGGRVLVGADGKPTGLLPAEGRESIPVQRLTLNGESHVIPGDARALIRAGTLEERCAFQRAGHGAGPPSPVKISYSTDGGTTWKKAPVAEGAVKIDNPRAGSVSLRAEIKDRHGNKAVQTIIDAYLTR